MRVEQMQWLLEVGTEIGHLQAENEQLEDALTAEIDPAEGVTQIDIKHVTPEEIVQFVESLRPGYVPSGEQAETNIFGEEPDWKAVARRRLNDINQLTSDLDDANDKIDGLESDLELVTDERAHARELNWKLASQSWRRLQCSAQPSAQHEGLRAALAVPPPGTFNQYQFFALLVAIHATARLAHLLGKTRYVLWSCERNRFESTELEPMNYVHAHPEENAKVRLIMRVDPEAKEMRTFEKLAGLLAVELGPNWNKVPSATYEPPTPEPHDELVQAAEQAIGRGCPVQWNEGKPLNEDEGAIMDHIVGAGFSARHNRVLSETECRFVENEPPARSLGVFDSDD